jgi:phage host-nuclease inhibitor protein Gam
VSPVAGFTAIQSTCVELDAELAETEVEPVNTAKDKTTNVITGFIKWFIFPLEYD